MERVSQFVENLLWRIFGTVPQFSIVALVLALLATCVGFRRPTWFFARGCGFAMIAMSTATFIAYRHRLSLLAGLQLILLLVHGTRLAVFLILRDLKPSFRRRPLVTHTTRVLHAGQRTALWFMVAFVYFCNFSPALYAAAGHSMLLPGVTVGLQIAGLTLMFGGMALEVLADWQKSAFKAIQPDSCCYSGLYRWVRQPNHLGEITIWTGNFIAAIGFYLSPMHWVLAGAGLAGITLLVIASARRLEHARATEYGAFTDYQEYVRSVPVLLPWLSPESLSPPRSSD